MNSFDTSKREYTMRGGYYMLNNYDYLDSYEKQVEDAITNLYYRQAREFKVVHSNQYISLIRRCCSGQFGAGEFMYNRYVDLCLANDASSGFAFNVVTEVDRLAHRLFVESYMTPIYSRKITRYSKQYEIDNLLPEIMNIVEHQSTTAKMQGSKIFNINGYTYTYTLKHRDNSLSTAIVTVMADEVELKIANLFVGRNYNKGVAIGEFDIEIDDVVTLPVGKYDIELSKE